MFRGATGGGGMGDEVVNSLADARAGKPIATSVANWCRSRLGLTTVGDYLEDGLPGIV